MSSQGLLNKVSDLKDHHNVLCMVLFILEEEEVGQSVPAYVIESLRTSLDKIEDIINTLPI